LKIKIWKSKTTVQLSPSSSTYSFYLVVFYDFENHFLHEKYTGEKPPENIDHHLSVVEFLLFPVLSKLLISFYKISREVLKMKSYYLTTLPYKIWKQNVRFQRGCYAFCVSRMLKMRTENQIYYHILDSQIKSRLPEYRLPNSID